jgi:hypothetical protein
MLERFLNLPVIIETPVGPIVGVLIQAQMGIRGRWILQVHAFIGSCWLISDWWCIKRI